MQGGHLGSKWPPSFRGSVSIRSCAIRFGHDTTIWPAIFVTSLRRGSAPVFSCNTISLDRPPRAVMHRPDTKELLAGVVAVAVLTIVSTCRLDTERIIYSGKHSTLTSIKVARSPSPK